MNAAFIHFYVRLHGAVFSTGTHNILLCRINLYADFAANGKVDYEKADVVMATIVLRMRLAWYW
jgi:hypothetical protein